MGRVVSAHWHAAAPGEGPPWRRRCSECSAQFETNVFAKATCSGPCSAARRRAKDKSRREARRAGLPPAGRSVRLGPKACPCGDEFVPRSGRQLRCEPCRHPLRNGI